MLSRVLRAAPTRLTSVCARRTLHISAARRDLIQDLYSKEISNFKPRQLTEKDAEGSVLKWIPPAAPKTSGDEVEVNQLDAYAKASVEVEGSDAAVDAAEDASSSDWFPIVSCDELDAEH